MNIIKIHLSNKYKLFFLQLFTKKLLCAESAIHFDLTFNYHLEFEKREISPQKKNQTHPQRFCVVFK